MTKEDVANILPLGMETVVMDKRNARNLVEMSHQRLCSRAYWEYRMLMHDIMKALSEYSPQWKFIVDNYMKPKCDVYGYCTEHNSCGRKEKKI
jgi:thymidylate synthase (FAD)